MHSVWWGQAVGCPAPDWGDHAQVSMMGMSPHSPNLLLGINSFHSQINNSPCFKLSPLFLDLLIYTPVFNCGLDQQLHSAFAIFQYYSAKWLFSSQWLFSHFLSASFTHYWFISLTSDWVGYVLFLMSSSFSHCYFVTLQQILHPQKFRQIELRFRQK